MKEAGRAGSVIIRNIPFVTQSSSRKRGCAARIEISDCSVSPESHFTVGGWNLDLETIIIGIWPVDFEDGAGERVFWLTAVSWRAEIWIAPGARPCRWVLRV